MIVGPGGVRRGSIVAYTLKITNLDPLGWAALRTFPQSGPHLHAGYRHGLRRRAPQGRDRVRDAANTAPTAWPASSPSGPWPLAPPLRDVGRVLGLTFQGGGQGGQRSSRRPSRASTSRSRNRSRGTGAQGALQGDPQVKRLIDLAISSKAPRAMPSQHVCGVVIARPRSSSSPCCKGPGRGRRQVIQYSLHSAEVTGLLKMDFLGLSNLAVIRDAIDIIEAVHGDRASTSTPSRSTTKPTYELLGPCRDDRSLPAGIRRHEAVYPRTQTHRDRRYHRHGGAVPPGVRCSSSTRSSRASMGASRSTCIRCSRTPSAIPTVSRSTRAGHASVQRHGGLHRRRGRHVAQGDGQEDREAHGRDAREVHQRLGEARRGKSTAEGPSSSNSKFAAYGFSKSHAACLCPRGLSDGLSPRRTGRNVLWPAS